MKILEWICKCGFLAFLITALIFASIARMDAQDKAAEQAALIQEHKDNEERLANELAAAIQQKAELEEKLFAEKERKLEMKPEIVEVEVIKEIEVEVPPENEYSSITMTENEKDLLWWILALEAKDQPDVGQRGVIEVIFNRVLSPEWPNTVEEVLYQPRQFSTIPYLTHPYVQASQKEMDNIDFVLEHGRTVLPEDYVFFASYKANGSGFLQIEDHYFARG